ncbi:MAG: twin transmembrane helix small protein [Xanthomonadales bacterium]
MAIKILIIVFLVVILYSLASALVFLVKDHGEGDRTVKRLTWRIGLSLVLFIFLWVAYQMGWVKPHQGPVGMQLQEQSQAPDDSR